MIDPMHAWFTGWRRKAGCVTLVMACVVMGMWAGSFVVKDVATISSHFGQLQIVSARGQIAIWTQPPDTWNDIDWRRTALPVDQGLSPGLSGVLDSNTIWIAPHWVVAAPLAAISASLLLRKPRSRT